MESALKVATHAARAAGEVLISYFDRIHIEDSKEKSLNDFVSEADIKSEETIKNILLSFDQGVGFLGEEGGGEFKKDVFWVVDPLDGTKNFLHGFPFFSISIALIENEKPVIGVIYEPLRDQLFYALSKKGAFLNDARIHVFLPAPTRLALIATGFPFKRKNKLDTYLMVFKKVFETFSGVRRAGSAALDLAYTARGTFSGFFEFGLSIWDIAAGSLIVQEAGGIVRDFEGKNNYLSSGNIVAGEPHVVEALLKIIETTWT